MCPNKGGGFHYFGSYDKMCHALNFTSCTHWGYKSKSKSFYLFVFNLQWTVVNCDKVLFYRRHGIAEFTKETPLSFSMCSKLSIRCCLLITNWDNSGLACWPCNASGEPCKQAFFHLLHCHYMCSLDLLYPRPIIANNVGNNSSKFSFSSMWQNL